MRVDESWRSNASESCNSHQLSSLFDRAFTTFSVVNLASLVGDQHRSSRSPATNQSNPDGCTESEGGEKQRCSTSAK